MIKKVSLLTALSVTAFSGWAQETDNNTMTVTANRFQQPVNSVLAPTSIVTREDIDRWQAKSMTDIVRRLPGVGVSRSGGLGQLSSIYIRGTEAKHALILIDGIPFARSGIANEIDIEQIPVALVQRIELIRGPRSAVYGSGAIGGVINIITRGGDEKSQIGVGVGSKGYQEYSGTVRQRFAGTLATLAGSYQATNGFNVQPASSYSVDQDRDGFRNKSFWGGLEHKFNDNLGGFFRGFGYGNSVDYDAGYLNGGDERQFYNQSWDAGLLFNQGIYSSQLIANYQTLKDYNYASVYGLYGTDTSLDRMEQRYIQWGNNILVGHGSISAGIDWKQERLVSSSPYGIDPYQREDTGVYLTAQQQLGRVTLDASGREDHDDQFGWHGTWQTAVGWEFVDGYRATLSYGTGFLAPSLGQQFGAGRFGIAANPNLKPEESKQWEAGLEGLTGPLNWRLSTYRYEIENLITYSNTSYYNVKSATIEGVELTGSFDTGIFTHHISLGYNDPRDDQTGKLLNRRSQSTGQYELSMNVYDADVDVIYQYNGRRFDDRANTVRLPSYSTVDLAASYPITSHLTVRGRIANLFDKDYETAYGYRTAGREYYLTGSYTF
ncbi:TonB-dependent vitamin B12 receptor BtuB [Pectobacterium aquaticum]|uniref:TonB-dependent vitamin B12 receptor BtuB n=1 Tax=Pectobacterium aquaticum TaxID=2204145 RepID=UPI000C7F76E9|nr:TonB-dependent vitamin B12 receptor BtuB [Pectobacterium aquaticum]PLY37029.1 vitamin B12/cobalamin outer membrane transporter [Pectobacterium carotovorum]RRN94014.1 TonB-dependent vitamin B12 receptor BtuB [Pectobacterium aquaticum]RRO07571.1 TonB-dependent vitamin B12 receptor BtuB [Pectobacterium aquaticum]